MLYGFLNIYKEKGKTSFDVIRELRKKLNIKKIGHTGTLDPLAEGVLIVAVGQATKLIEFMMKDEKDYSAEIILGKNSDTYDAEGKIEDVGNQKPDFDKVQEVVGTFIGEIEQIPPKYSALKINGKKAYEMARNGEEFEMKSRKVTIKNIAIIDYKYPFLEIDVSCSSGTYIRSLANDIGKKLETGAYLNALKRTRVGNFIIKNSINLKEFKESDIIPVEAVSLNYECIEIDENDLKKLNLGQFIEKNEIKDQIVCAFYNNKLIGIIERTKNGLYKYKKKLNI
ncbi:tRNA pseudouridine(55) synthase TruB [Patescibacteria group bacterium]